VEFKVFTAGEYKRTVHPLIAPTSAGEEKFQQEMDEVHMEFQAHVGHFRGDKVKVDEVSTGEAWLATQALSKGLVDTLMTSDEHLSSKAKDGFELIHIGMKEVKKPWKLWSPNLAVLAKLIMNSAFDAPRVMLSKL